MIHKEVSHLSSLPCWAECINPAAFRVAVLNLSSLKHITSCCRWLSACFKIELFIFTTNWNGNSLTLQLPLHLGCIKTICDLVTVLKSWFHNHKGMWFANRAFVDYFSLRLWLCFSCCCIFRFWYTVYVHKLLHLQIQLLQGFKLKHFVCYL